MEASWYLKFNKHLGENRVRAVAMDTTDGLVRGTLATDTGGPITVPVGDAVLGRVFDVTGQPIDERGDAGESERYSIHRPPPPQAELTTAAEMLETGIKVIDLIQPGCSRWKGRILWRCWCRQNCFGR